MWSRSVYASFFAERGRFLITADRKGGVLASKGISKLETSFIGKLMAELCVQATFSVMLYNIYWRWG